MERTERILKEIMDDASKEKPNEKIVPMQRLVQMRDSSATLRVPERPITSPDQCAAIFRQIFRGARQEIAAVISLTAQYEFLNAAPIAYGGIREVHIDPRNLFTEVCCRTNAAYFVLGHNHPSGSILPSDADLKLLKQTWRDSWYYDCPMRDFMIFGHDETVDYYSHRNHTYELETQPAPCSCQLPQ